MKNTIKLLAVLFLSLTLVKCTDKGEDSAGQYIKSSKTVRDSVNQKSKKYIKGCFPVYKNDTYPVDSVPFDQITHLTICFAWPNADGTLYTSEINDINHIVSKCHQNDVKAILNIGGAGVGEHFPTVSIDSALRKKFVTNLTNYVDKHKIDGVEIDWEYWPTPEKVDTIVSKGIVSLFRDLRSSLPNNLALSYDVYPTNWYGKHYPSELINYADEIVIMAFAATGSWSETGHHSPLSWVEQSYNYWIGRIGKKNKQKVIISTPFYGFNFRNDHTAGNKNTASSIGYRELLAEHPEAYSRDTIKTDSSVIFHNGIRTFKQKIDFIKEHDLKGISIWELSFDHVPEDKSLLKYIHEEMNR